MGGSDGIAKEMHVWRPLEKEKTPAAAFMDLAAPIFSFSSTPLNRN
jgi:hypothetical protein